MLNLTEAKLKSIGAVERAGILRLTTQDDEISFVLTERGWEAQVSELSEEWGWHDNGWFPVTESFPFPKENNPLLD